MIAVQETNNGTLATRKKKAPSRNFGAVCLVVHPFLTDLVDSKEIIPPSITTLRPQSLRHKKIIIINCYSPTDAADGHELNALYYQLEEVVCNDKSYNEFIAETSLPEQKGLMETNTKLETLD